MAWIQKGIDEDAVFMYVSEPDKYAQPRARTHGFWC